LRTQAGWVSEVKVPRDMAELNFENPNAWERESLVRSYLDGKYIVNQYQMNTPSWARNIGTYGIGFTQPIGKQK
jgi:hypothetical protein